MRTLLFYAAAVTLLIAGWQLRSLNLIDASAGAGYWLGIIGASLMGLLLFYPLRKRLRSLRFFGSVRGWFQAHMIFGIVGPLLVVLHSNFQLGSLNSRVALFTTLVVAGSGVIGRYLYSKIHHGLFGQRASLTELRARVLDGQGGSRKFPGLGTELENQLQAFESRYLEDRNFLECFIDALGVSFRATLLRWRLLRSARRELDEAAVESDVVAAHRERLGATLKVYLRSRLAIVRRVAQFRASERLFSLWHIVHFPLFLIMVGAVILHVIAVHMY